MIRVAIAEERAITRWALREAIGGAADFAVVGDAGTVEDTVAMLERTKPDVLVLSLALPDHAGYDVLARIRDLDAGPLVIVLGAQTEPSYAARAISAGAHGYVSTYADPAQLLDAIRAVDRGERVVPPGVEPLLAAGDGHPASSLTKRELQVMEMLARGMTNREIADHLDISIKTIDTHRGHILKKLRLRNNSELTRFAVKHGYISA
ncbi:MAG TPA: response regulator transcription factor [Kofleriaceae bacterium]|nr:response regulator transcription factor [Kofleriaceae bacterium]